MIEALEYYQSLAQRFQGQLLTGPGILIVLLGLSLWLAGLRWRKVIGAMAGAAVMVCIVLAVGQNGAAVVASACGIGIIVGAVIEKVVLGIFGAVFTAGLVIFIIALNTTAESAVPGVEFYNANEPYNTAELTADDFMTGSSYPMWPEYEDPAIRIAAPAAMEITFGMAQHFIDKAKTSLGSCKTGCYASAGFAAIIVAILAMAMPRVYISIISAVIGSAVIFVGMIMLLFNKGSAPISLIASRAGFFAVVFAVMVIFGSIVQILLSRPRPIVTKKEAKDKGKE